MGKKTRFNVKPKWLFLFLSLFACVFGAISGAFVPQVSSGIQAAYSNSNTASITFDFEEAAAHRTSGANNYTTPNSYTANGVSVSLQYADSITDSPISGTACLAARVASGTTNSPVIIIGPINMSSYGILCGVRYSSSGTGSLTLASSYSTNGSTWTAMESHVCPGANTVDTFGSDLSLDCSGLSSFYIRFVVTITNGTSTNSNRTVKIDDVIIYTSGSSSSSSSSSSSTSSSSSPTSSSSSSSATSSSGYSSLPSISVAGWEASDYYSSLVSDGYLSGKSGWNLADDIHKIMWATTTSRRSYDKLATDHLPISDADPTNSAYLLDFWTGQPLINSGYPTVWNLEHVWPAANSYGAWQSMNSGDKRERYAGQDIHHIRPSAATVNKTRGNGALGIVDVSKSFEYVTVNGVTSDCKDGLNSEGYKVFEPEDNKKGDIARIFFYLYVTYSTTLEIDGTRSPLTVCTSYDSGYPDRTSDLSKVIIDGDRLSNAGVHIDDTATLIDIRGTDYTNTIDMLLAWNELDPVDALESRRNDYAAEKQGNRNPFIDFPDIANYIFDAQGQTFYDMQMDAEQTVLLSDGTFASTARTMPASALASVVYTSSDSSVFSVSGSTFTVHKAGSARLTGTVTIGGIITIARTTTVRVVSPITDIALSPETNSSNRYVLTKGKSFKPVANAVPSDAYDQGMTWSSSNDSIATVNSTTGKIRAVGVGNCNITVTSTADGSVSSIFYLEVINVDAGVVDIEADTFDMETSGYAVRMWTSGDYSGSGRVFKSDAQLQMQASGDSYVYNSNADSDVIEKIILFSSLTDASSDSDYDIYASTEAMTSSNYTTKGTKIATVTCPTYGGSVTCDLGGSYSYFYIRTVGSYAHYLSRIRLIIGDYTPALESISFDCSEMTRNYVAGDTLSLAGLTVYAVFDDDTTVDVTSSSTFTPANGTVLATTDSAVTVSYTSGSLTLTDDVPIRVDSPKVLSSVAAMPSTVTISAGRTTALRLKATYADGSTEVVTSSATWTSSNETLATVNSSGLVSTLGPGEATITGSFTYKGVTKSSSSVLTIIESDFALSVTSFTCLFDDDSFVPEFTAMYGETDVTASCTYSEPLVVDDAYVYYRTLGVHEFVLTYTAGTTTYRRVITITTTNVGVLTPGTIGYSQVTDESGLVAGMHYIITNSATLAGSKVMSTTQNSNNRGQVDFSAGSASMQILTLGGSAGAWTLYTGSGYLYAASSSSNYLKTEASVDSDGNANWDIGFSSGVASIVAQGTNTIATLRHNSGSKLFSCYAGSSNQSDVFLFALMPEQAMALKDYLDTFRTCDVVTESQVRRLALEYNALNCTTIEGTTSKAAFGILFTAAQYEYGVDYWNGQYRVETPSGDSVLCFEKLEYIVARWNTEHPSQLVYLYKTSYYAGTDNGGSGGEAPILAVSEFAIQYKQEESPLTTTLWIVIGAGMAGMVAIGAAYLVSKKKKYRA